MADPILLDGAPQHGGDVILGEEIGEASGAVATSERQGHAEE
jgi:hypothetical protein